MCGGICERGLFGPGFFSSLSQPNTHAQTATVMAWFFSPREKREALRDLTQQHREYAACMSLLYSFRSKHGEQYASDFLALSRPSERGEAGSLHGDGTSEFDATDRCRALTKDYRRGVLRFHASFGPFIDPTEQAEYVSRHKRFRDLVQPHDNALRGRDDSDSRRVWTYPPRSVSGQG